MAKEFWENDTPAQSDEFWSGDKLDAQKDLPAGVTPSTAGAGRGSINPEQVSGLAQAFSKGKSGSVLEGVTLPDPQLDPELNRQAMLKSGSPDSVMFTAGRGKQNADQMVERGAKLEDLAARGKYGSVPDMIEAQADSDARKQFAKRNPNVAAVASGAANMLKGSINAPGALAGFVNKTMVDPVLGLAGAGQMPRVQNAPGTDELSSMASDYMPEVAKLPMEKAWDKGVFGEWLAANVSAQVPQLGGQIAGVINPVARAAILPVMGAQAAGGAHAEDDDPRVAVAKGVLEVLSEGASFGVADKIKDAILKMPQSAQNAVFANIAKRALAAGGAVTGQMLAGAIEESVAQVGGNALDIYASGQNKPLMDKVGDSAVIGAFAEAGMGLPNAATALQDNSPRAQVARELAGTLNNGSFRPQPGSNPSPTGPSAEDIARQEGFLAREQRIKTLTEAGDTATADLLQKKHERQTAIEQVDGELQRMAMPTDAAQIYRNMRGTGMKPAEAAARSAVTTTFQGFAAQASIQNTALMAALDKANGMPLDEVPAFLGKFAAALERKGLAQPAPVDLAAEIEAARDNAIESAMGAVYQQGDVRASMNDVLALEQAANEQNPAQGTDTAPTQAPGEAPQVVAGDAAASSELPTEGSGAGTVEGGGVKAGDYIKPSIGADTRARQVESVGPDGWVYTKSGEAFKPDQVELTEKPQPKESGGFGIYPGERNSTHQENVARWNAGLTKQPAQPVTGEGAGASQPTQAATAFIHELRDSGTLSIKGDFQAIKDKLTAGGIDPKKITKSATGVVVGASQAKLAQEILNQPQEPVNAQADHNANLLLGDIGLNNSSNGASIDSKIVGNLLGSNALTSKGFNGLDAYIQASVQRHMLRISHNPEVLKSVIELIPIDVVNMLARQQLTPEMLFHDPSMLKDGGVGTNGDNPVPIGVDAATPIVRVVASVTAKNPAIFEFGHSGRLPVNTDAAGNTSVPGAVDVIGGLPGHVDGPVPGGADGVAVGVGGAENQGRVPSDSGPAKTTINGKHVVTPTSDDVPGTVGGETPSVPPTVSKNSISVKQSQPQETQAAAARVSRADLTPEQQEQIAPVLAQDFEKLYQRDIKDGIKRRLGLVKETEADQKKTPFKSFLQRFGISPAHTSDIFGRNRFKASQILPATFKAEGLSLDDLAERAVEHGFMTESDAGDTNKLISLIQSEVAGDTQVSSEFADEDAAAQHERVQRMQIEDMAESMGLPFDNEISTDRLASMVNRVSDRVARAPKDGLLKPERILKNARDAAMRVEQKRAQLAKQLVEFEAATIQEQDALIDLFVNDDGIATTFMRTVDVQTANQWLQSNPTWTNENATDTRANQDSGQAGAPVAGVTQEGAGHGSQTDSGTQQGSGQEQGAGQEGLTAPTRADILAQQERTEKANQADAKAKADAENKAKADAELGEFTLTGSNRAADVGAASGQNSMFEPEPEYTVDAPRRKYQSDKQGDLFNDQLDLFLNSQSDASQAGPAVEVSRRDAAAAVQNLHATGSVLAQALSSDYAARQRVNLVGQTVGSSEDLATLAQVYRDPRFETFRVVFTGLGGKVVSQIGLTSRLPGSTSAIVGNDLDGYLKDLSRTAIQRGASGYYLLHNHPSGNANASEPDRKLTAEFSIPGLKFKGHVIIDTNEYSVIDAQGVAEKFKHDFGQSAPMTSSQWGGTVFAGPQDVMAVAKQMQVDDDAVTLIVTDSQYKVMSVATIPHAAIGPNREANRLMLSKAALQGKGSQLFAVGRNQEILSKLNGDVMDAVHISEAGKVTSLAETGAFRSGSPLPRDRRTRMSPDTSPEFGYLRPFTMQAAQGRKVAEPGQDQIDTPAFKAWYGDWQNAGNEQSTTIERTPGLAGQPAGRPAMDSGRSGPIDSQGRPTRLYHGTADDITAFEVGHRNSKDHGWLGRGVYLTDSSELADSYANLKAGGAWPNVMPVYAAIKNPFEATLADKKRIKNGGQAAAERFTAKLKAEGFDGVVLTYPDGIREFVAFDPTQVKSSTGNNGNWDGTNPNITQDLSRVSTKIASMGYEAATVPRLHAAQKLASLVKRLEEGKITENYFTLAVKGLSLDMANVSDTKSANRIMTERQRGVDLVREKLIRARRQGDLDPQTVEFALWALDQNPSLAENLGISIRAPKDGSAAADYNPAAEIMRLFKGKGEHDSAVHEILHHAERMMPPEMQSAIRKEWAAALAKAIKNATPEQQAALAHIPAALSGDQKAYNALVKAIQEGPLTYAEHYQLINPSEFWAVNGSRILANQFLSKDSVWLRVRDWLRNMTQTVKGLLGLRSDAAIIKALRNVTDPENFGAERGGRFMTDEMLSNTKGMKGDGVMQNIRTTNQQSLFPPTIWNMPEPTRMDRLIYELQDKSIDLKRAHQAIEKAGNQITEQWDARLAETLYPGRVAYRSKGFLDDEVKPLLTAMAMHKMEMDELADYLHARGAQERNAQIAKVNPDLPDGGSGTNTKGELMTNQAAADYLANIRPARKQVLDAMAKRVDAITKGTRDLLVTEGLEKQSTIDAWEGAYKNYVPMFRDEAESGVPHPQGAGFTVRGSASKRATGSTKEVTNILAHVLMQREAAITRAEKNRVALSLYGLALSNPNRAFWITIKPSMTPAQIAAELVAMGVDPLTAQAGMDGVPTIRTVDPITNTVVDRPNPMYKSLPGAITLRVNGEDRVLMLNEKDVRAARLAASLKNLHGLTELDIAGSIVGKATRWLASVNTQYNPAFGLTNLTRDVLGGVINLGSTELRGNALKVLTDTPMAIIGIARELISGGQTGKWQTLYRQFQADGGQTGFKDNWRDPNERAKALEAELKTLGKGKWAPSRAAHAILSLLDGFNTTLENAVRLSAYSQALDKGISRPNAARLGRELTVDFNRKGRAGTELGPLYAFFNASVQGTARTIDTIKGPTGKLVIAGGLGLGVTQALMLLMAGYDDDEIPEFVKSRALIIPLFGKEKNFISIPYPLGLHVIPNTGRVLAELALNGGKDAGKRTGLAIGEIASAFNPLGGGSNIFTTDGFLKTVAFTTLDWLIEIDSNKDFTGRAIEKKAYSEEGDVRPGVERAKEATRRSTTGQVYMEISKAINSMTGGTDFIKGAASPTPEMVRYLAQTVGGGLLRELEKTVNASTAASRGEKVKSSQIPVLGRFYGEVDDNSVQQSRYYDASTRIGQLQSVVKALENGDQFKTLDDFEKGNPETELIRDMSRSKARISKLNKQAVATINDPQALAEIDADRVLEMRDMNNMVKEVNDKTRKPTLADMIKPKREAAMAQ